MYSKNFYNTSMKQMILIMFLIKNYYQEPTSLQLKGSADLGYYTVDAVIGSEKHKVSLILDTGSNLMIIPCKGCTYCNDKHNNEFYDPNQSKTFR